MAVDAGTIVTIDIEKPAAGGRMLARHAGQVVLVWGAIPGERVRARIERTGKGVLYASTTDVLDPSPDRRDAGPDWHCGGNVLAHVAYERQRLLKGEIVRDALQRIGRVPLGAPPDVLGSPEHGYRMRARLHVRNHRVGFFREGTHDICDAALTGQLLPDTLEWIHAAGDLMRRDRLDGISGVEIAENVAGSERACHLLLEAGADAGRFGVFARLGPSTGVSAARADRPGIEQLAGTPVVSDVLHLISDDPSATLRLRREVRAFFQGNRYLLERLVRHVAALVPAGPVVDLYAGVGLFGLALAAMGGDRITLVESDPISGASLVENAEPFGSRVTIVRQSVERFLAGPRLDATTYIVDPPRTGMSKEALAGVARSRPARVIYVSCDVATFARDTRMLLDSGYELEQLSGIDLFPNTAHVEVVAAFTKPSNSDRNSPVR